jgi:hypothetical protein
LPADIREQAKTILCILGNPPALLCSGQGGYSQGSLGGTRLDATGDRMCRSGVNTGFQDLGKVNRKILNRGLNYDGIKGCTLDVDATGIEASEKTAKTTRKGYSAIIAHGGPSGGKRTCRSEDQD